MHYLQKEDKKHKKYVINAKIKLTFILNYV